MRGLRYPAATLLELLASGMTVEEILEDYPDLERDDAYAALEYGALAAGRSGRREVSRRRAVDRWARQDSNLRPTACKAVALPLSYAPGPGANGAFVR